MIVIHLLLYKPVFLYYFLPNSNIQLVNCDDTKDSNWTDLRLPIHCQFIYDDSQYSFLLYFIFGHLHLLLSTLIVIVFLLIQIAIIYIYIDSTLKDIHEQCKIRFRGFFLQFHLWLIDRIYVQYYQFHVQQRWF